MRSVSRPTAWCCKGCQPSPVSRLPTLAHPGLYITFRPVPAFDTRCDHHRFSRSLSNSTCQISPSCAYLLPTGHWPSEVPTLAVSYCVTSRRRAPCHCVAYACPFGFRGPRFQSASPTSNDTSSRYRLLACGQQRLDATPDSGLFGRRYTLELCSDPLFPEVPPESDFSARADGISAAMTAFVSGTRRALSMRAVGGTCTRFHPSAGHTGISSGAPCPCRPIFFQRTE
jgi:hypothetical protein